MALRVQPHPTYKTKDRNGSANGFLIPVFNVHDGFVPSENHPQQIYLTVCDPGSIKGPHLHLKRWGLFTCIQGNIKIIVREGNEYQFYYSGKDYEYATIEVPPGIPAALQNIGDEPAYIINAPAPAWKADDVDEHKVTFDESVFDLTK